MIACAERILLHEDPDLLSSKSKQKQYLLQRIDFVKRTATSKVENFAQVKFLLEVKQVITMAPELIINFDQTGLNVVPVSDWTIAAVGAKRVKVAAKNDKKQLIALLGGSLTGDFLPPQIIYQGKTSQL